jgi:hypothetical protein
MLLPDEVRTQLQRRWHEWQTHENRRQAELRLYGEALNQLWRQSEEEVRQRATGARGGVALPTSDWERAVDGRIDPQLQLTDHQAARDWAAIQLEGRTTLAVDGSQIPPLPEIGLPLAAIQAAIFINPHTRTGEFERALVFALLSPEQISPALPLESEAGRRRPTTEQWINLHRFELEVSTLGMRLRQLADRAEKKGGTLAFLDSPLTTSFADLLPPPLPDRHAVALGELLQIARDIDIPVVGYIDVSQAHDLLRLLEHHFALPPATKITDAELLHAARHLPWGARTPFLKSPRGLPGRTGEIGFLYLQTTGAEPPARLELPAWVAEAGKLDELIALVLAEVIVGNGYPYPIESADAAAALTARDRDRFVALVHQVATRNGTSLPSTSPAKARSKARRR